MKKIVFIFGLLSTVWFSNAQSNYTDSLLNVIRSSKDVQTRLDAAAYYTWHNVYEPVEPMMQIGEQLENIGKDQGYTDVQAFGKMWIGWAYSIKGETYQALTCMVGALKLAETVHNNSLFASIFNGFGATYSRANLVERSMQNYKEALSYLEGTNTQATNLVTKRIVLTNLGILFNYKQEYDSALNYLQRAMELWVLLTKDSRVNPGLFYGRLGNTYLALRQNKLAYACYQTNLDYAKRFKSARMISAAYYWLGKYHLQTGNEDSALDYFQLALPFFDEKVVGADYQVDLPLNLYLTFKRKGNDKEALKYLELYNNAKQKEDSLHQKHQMEVLSFEEDQRQQTVAAEKVKRAEERIRNLQYAAIALGLLSFVILFFLLSHSIIANPKIIRFLGVIALLIAFEFIYLLIHPLIGELTDYSPLLMLFIMVCVAAVLVPLHHKIEHSIIQRLVEKNNRIRLAAAKKTIAQLEGKVIDVPVEKSADGQHEL